MDFLQNYVTFHSRYEMPRAYVLWSGIALLGAVVNRKVHFCHGDVEIHTNLLVLMVGPAGNGKTTCCSFAKGFFEHACPDLEIGASTQSAEEIVQVMAKPEFGRVFTNENDEQIEVRPYAFFVNEFKNFIAYNPIRMINFLTDIYDTKVFKSGTIKRGTENIINPSLNMLACENPDQLIGFMKNSVMTGGLARRIIMVNEFRGEEAKPIIIKTPESIAAEDAIKSRLVALRTVVGEFKWAPSGIKFYDPWYRAKFKELASVTNPIIEGYKATKHIQLFKVCMLLDAVSDKPMFLFTDDLLQHGLVLLDSIEANMPKLSVAAGRNEMSGPQQKILEILKDCGGMMSEKTLKRKIETELTPFETTQVLRHLVDDTDQVLRKLMAIPNEQGNPVERYMLVLPEVYEKGLKEGKWKVKS